MFRLLSVLFALNATIAYGDVVSYRISAVITEPVAAYDTFFNGSFDWDGTTVTNLHGTMNSSMYDTNDVNPDYYNSFPLLQLNYQLGQSVNGNIVTASVFKENSSDVFKGGGYVTVDELYYGYQDGNARNWNAYFTFAFDKSTMEGVLEDMVYGDCTVGGMMGRVCMTGHRFGGTMAAVPESIRISEVSAVSAVPVPGAIWLFGSALAGLMMGINRKRAVTV